MRSDLIERLDAVAGRLDDIQSGADASTVSEVIAALRLHTGVKVKGDSHNESSGVE